jgi:hypothetical protein
VEIVLKEIPKDIANNIQTQLTERLSNPLGGSFVIAWLLLNYKFIIILLSLNTVSTTFKLIETLCFPTISTMLLNGVLFPLVMALLYLFVFPYPAKFVYEFTQKRQKEIHEIRQRIVDETPLTIEESRAIRVGARSLEESHNNEMLRKEKEILTLKEELTDLKKTVPTSVNGNISTPKFEPNKEQLKLLLKIGESHAGESAENLFLLVNDTKIKVEFDLGELAKNGYVKKSFNGDDYVYEITHDGRACLVGKGADLL